MRWLSVFVSDFIGEYFPLLMVLFIIALLAFVTVGIYSDVARRKILMAQCMADGKKEYECYAMLRNNGNTHTYIPMVVPVGGR